MSYIAEGRFAMTVELGQQKTPVYVDWSGREFDDHIECDEIKVTLTVQEVDGSGYPLFDLRKHPMTVELELWDVLEQSQKIAVENAVDADMRRVHER